MRELRFAPLFSLALAVAACSGGGSGSTISDELQADLKAAASKVELAGQSTAQPMRFVSELEQGKNSEEVQRERTPRRVAARTTGETPQQEVTPSPEVSQEVQVAQPSPAAEAPQPTSDAPSVPMVAPRPASLPVDVPTEGFGRGAGSGGVGAGDYGGGIGIGDVIGVVIRGGGVGPDHCPPRRRPRGRLPMR